MNAGVVEEQIAQRKSAGKKKWPFGKKSSSSKEDKAAAASATPEEEEVDGMRVDFYLVVFLKFIASIVPTIEVDSTTAF